MSDYSWKVSGADQAPPPPPPPILSDAQAIVAWALANAIGLAVSFFIGLGLAGGAPTETLIIGSIISAILIGWVEMLILMLQRVKVKGWWVINTVLAFFTWGAAFPILRSVNLWSGLALGLLLGAFQWINLRNKIEHASYWVIANVVGWGIALILFVPLAGISWLVAWAVCGLVGGAMTGFAMSRLVHQPIIEYDEAPLRDNYQE